LGFLHKLRFAPAFSLLIVGTRSFVLSFALALPVWSTIKNCVPSDFKCALLTTTTITRYWRAKQREKEWKTWTLLFSSYCL